MGILDRLTTVVKSNLNALLDKAEDPEKILNQLIFDMREQLNEAKKEVAVAIADEKRLEKQYEAEQAAAADWERRAMLAVEKGDDTLAREALRRKGEHDTLVAQYKVQWDQQKESTEKLRSALVMLNNKIEEAMRRKNLLIARQKRSEAQKKIQQTMSGLSDRSAFEAFERMSAKVDRIESEAEAAVEVTEELEGGEIEKKFKALEGGGHVDDALAALKAKMGKSS